MTKKPLSKNIKKRERKKSPLKPDFKDSCGSIQMNQYGNISIMKNNMTGEDHKLFLKELSDNYDEVVGEINTLIDEITSLVVKMDYKSLLERCTWEELSLLVGIKAESELGASEAYSQFRLRYILSLVTAIEQNPEDVVNKEEQNLIYGDLDQKIESLYNKIITDYPLVNTARLKELPDYNEEMDRFKVKARFLWFVTGKRYSVHQKEYLEELLAGHDAIFKEVFGQDVEEVIKGLTKIQEYILSIPYFMQEAMEIQEEVTSLIDFDSLEKEDDFKEAVASKLKSLGKYNRLYELLDLSYGNKAFQVDHYSGLSKSFLESLSISPAGNANYLKGPNGGWPTKFSEILRRPFLKLEEGFFCFSTLLLVDDIYRNIYRAIKKIKPEYSTKWNELQKLNSEKLPLKLLQEILTGAEVIEEGYYQFIDERGKERWTESDSVLIYDGNLFAIEVKAGAFTYTSPEDDLESYLNSIESLVFKPAVQGERLLDTLGLKKKVILYSDNKKSSVKKVLKFDEFRNLSIITITLDQLTDYATRMHNYSFTGVGNIKYPVWSVSIDDLFVYRDVFKGNPLKFIHYTFERFKCLNIANMSVLDELDFIGLYNEHNMFSKYAKENLRGAEYINWIGYRDKFDEYFHQKLIELYGGDNSPLDIPLRKRGWFFEGILQILNSMEVAGKTEFASKLLDFSTKAESDVENNISTLYKLQESRKRVLPLCLHGEIRFSFVFTFDEHTYDNRLEDLELYYHAVMLNAKEQDRVVVIAEFENEGTKLANINFKFINEETADKCDQKKLKEEMERHKEKRVSSYTNQVSKGKIGRNEKCPCGSGKKYKKCCLQ